MWINSALSGGATKLDGDKFGALECAGLLMVSPVGSPIAGWIQHNVVAAFSGMPASNWSGSRECTSPSSPEHVVSHQFSALIRECIVSPNPFQVEDPESELFGLEDDSERKALRIAARNFVDTWKQLIASSHPSRGASLLRHPLPITVRDKQASIQIQQTVVANRQRNSRDRQAAELVNSVQKLTMFDSGSPENGPVMWTIAYALLEIPGGSSMRLTELVSKVTTYLGSSRDGYVARIAQESIFRKVFSGDDLPAIELDYSGRGEPGPFSMHSNLSCSPGMYRLADSWIYEVSEFAKSSGEVPISLPLAVHLAILARTISDEEYDSGVPAVVVMGERRGWLYLKPDTLEVLSARGKLCIQIHDQGAISVKDIVGLEELIPNFADLVRRPTEMLRALGALLGMRILEDSDAFPLPGTIRIWVKGRGQTATSFDQEILEAALVAQRQLEGQVNGHE